MKRVRSSLSLDLDLNLLRGIRCYAGDLILGSLIDTCSKVHDNAGKPGMKECESCGIGHHISQITIGPHREIHKWIQ
jgi:hypothetical protein